METSGSLQEAKRQHGHVNRRTVVQGIAWSVPVVSAAVAAPTAAASVVTQTILALDSSPSGYAGELFNLSFRVMLGSSPVADEDVTFTILSGYGTLSTPIATTNSEGLVVVGLTPQQASGVVLVQASTDAAVGQATFSTLAPLLTVTPNVVSDPSQATTFTVTGRGYIDISTHPATPPNSATGITPVNDSNGIYVVILPVDTWSGEGPLSAATVAGGQIWVPKTPFFPGAPSTSTGSFTTSTTVPGGEFDPSVAYHVGTSAAHGLSVWVRTLDAFAPLTIG